MNVFVCWTVPLAPLLNLVKPLPAHIMVLVKNKSKSETRVSCEALPTCFYEYVLRVRVHRP